MRLVDARAGRFEQGVVAVILLTGFVFSLSWSIPVAMVIALSGTIFGERGPVARFWLAAVAPRLRGGRSMEPVPVARAQSLLISAGLVLATLVIFSWRLRPSWDTAQYPGRRRHGASRKAGG